MVFELAVKSGPHSIELSAEYTRILERDSTDEHQAVSLWLRTLTLEVKAPVSWWKQARRYFPDVLWLRLRPRENGTIVKPLIPGDFEEPVPSAVLDHLNALITAGQRSVFHDSIPDSFIRRGVVHTNLAVIRDILDQRGHYNDGHWAEFCRTVRDEETLKKELAILSSRPKHQKEEVTDV